MTTGKIRGLILVSAATIPSAAWAIELPEYDIGAYCSSAYRGAADGTPEQCFNKVMDDLMEAAAQSAQFKDEFVQRCIDDPRVEIYSDLLDCFAFQGTANDLK